MLHSMTAFAREEQQAPWGVAAWELRSVNHRYLDANVRLPEELRGLEPVVRERVCARLRRGKIECTLRYQPGTDARAPFAVDTELARRVVEASRSIGGLLGDAAPVNPMDILRWPGVTAPPTPDLDKVARAALDLLERTLDDLVESRAREGAKMAELVRARCDEIESVVRSVRERVPAVLATGRERLSARLAELRDQLDSTRLEQEMLILAHKMDVSEELDRLQSHTAEVRRVLSEDRPAGRRLEFLMQELNREANTLGSKSGDAEVSRASVDLKVLIEQAREQIQNVE
ncbi:MAG: YicC family protein [Gammaproteobacteria bacterium]|nr:YicC family protein [Gammaproteobacteria bacterium]NIR83948.1 YicC family protein [Gammaproteobacteria bacterium]NIR88991.1 YicC family protein [Gammaproteobacteria bacterium]NIV74544.1 YicC family protein [Gammaproteobacteria bacterium]